MYAYIYILIEFVHRNTLWPSGPIRYEINLWSYWVQVMSCYMRSCSHYREQDWLVANKTQWNTLEFLRTLQRRHHDHGGVSNHQPHGCLLNRLFRRRSKKTSKLCVTGLCVGNSPGTGEFPAQMASNAENVFIWWHHHEIRGGCELLNAIEMIILRWSFLALS